MMREGKLPAKGASAQGTTRPIADRLNELEAQLQETQWLGGQKLSSLDKEALDEIVSANAVSMISPLLMPNTYAWYAMVSKFSPEVRNTWPKSKAPTAPKGVDSAPKEEKKGNGNKDGGKKPADTRG